MKRINQSSRSHVFNTLGTLILGLSLLVGCNPASSEKKTSKTPSSTSTTMEETSSALVGATRFTATVNNSLKTSLALSSLSSNVTPIVIFQETMSPPWALNSWKWGNSYAAISSTKYFEGSKSILGQLKAAWAGVTLDSLDGSGNPKLQNSADYDSISFAFNPGSSSLTLIKNIQIALVQSSPSKLSQFVNIAAHATPALASNTWSQIKIPLSVLAASAQSFNQIVFFNNNNSTTALSFYVDNIIMAKKATSGSTPTPTPAPTASPTPVPTAPPASTTNGTGVTAPVGGVAFNVDSTKARLNVSPYIYGVNETVAFRLKGTPLYPHASFYRLGGNRTTTYNWENNASNAGMDWGPNISDSYFGSSTTAGQAVSNFINSAFAKNAATLVTVPIVPYVAANKNNVPLTIIAANDRTNWKINRAFKPAGASAITADKNDAYVYQQEFVTQMEATFGAFRNNQAALFYSLDNEPGIWAETHPLVMPQKLTYSDLLARSIEYGRMIKTYAAKEAMVFGAVAYGYNEYVNLQDAPDAAQNGNWFDYFLKNMKAAETTYGQRLLDVLDIHFYSEARTTDGSNTQVTSPVANPSAALISARVQAPRSLWDASYVENSWISKDYLGGPVNLLPSLKSKINQHYAGTKLAISEYSYGGENHISGAIAQADALGIFAREGVFAANYYELREGNFPYAGFDMYRNFDGAGSKVGPIMLSALTSDHSKTSVYSYTDANNSTVYLVAINKTANFMPVNIGINHTSALANAAAYQIDENNPKATYVGTYPLSGNRFSVSLPPYSVTTFVLK